MGYTTKISDYEWERGDGPKEVPEGVEVVTKSKVVEAEDKPAPKKTTARSKSDKS